MTSPYLDRPRRTLDQAQRDRADWTPRRIVEAGSLTPGRRAREPWSEIKHMAAFVSALVVLGALLLAIVALGSIME